VNECKPLDEGVEEGTNPDITLEAQFMIAAATAGLVGWCRLTL
jgi:hypothetical protein